MALQASAEVVQSAVAPAASNRVGPGGGRFTSGDRIDGLSGSPFVSSYSGQWRAADDSGLGQGGLNQWYRAPQSQIVFTPLVGLAAASYPAITSVQVESGNGVSPLSPTDLQHGVGVYEYYMRVTSGSTRGQGSVINRFS